MEKKILLTSPKEEKIWDDYLRRQPHPSFLQSWGWGELQKKLGRTIYKFEILDEGKKWCGVALIIVIPLPLNRSYLFIPRGPVLEDSNILSALIKNELFKQIIKKHRAIFLRFEPLQPIPQEIDHQRILQVRDREPSTTLLLNLQQSEEEILQKMKQKARYNIRLAQKHQVEVTFYDGSTLLNKTAELINTFWQLLKETSERHNLHHYPKKYYEKMIEVLSARSMLEVTVATHQGETLAINFNIIFGNTVTYLFGAATHHKKNLMAPYALQWHSILRGRELGKEWYDFYGISPENNPSHPLQNVTKFKKGFGGDIYNYPGTYELAFSQPWYKMWKIIKNAKFKIQKSK